MKLKYEHTKKGLTSRIYRAQVKNSKYRNHVCPNYTLNELRDWMYKQDIFNELYYNWKKSKFKHYLRPSCDRINDYLPYSLDNIQLKTWGENHDRYFNDVINGINTKQCKAVLQYDLEDTFIKEYYSIQQAERETGIHHINIIKTCKGQRNHAGGYYWVYKN
jgi:hypothetical protein